ncbi:hypothetical protein [Streptomyces alkaliterrae]|uniref:Dirigent protein n=1 Tax=Streptomyces alkaliterrae TaxID=2213162 RepID=A0A5P0YTU7_9ACTN|nr:hypothetical protein [Streptomyces alkaliterrae]MBB1258253.1 hypothetical protein [Streptomyces alkaliterrae]MQS03736.1 hypothetical protein [Streptomyces alkaliterrae]
MQSTRPGAVRRLVLAAGAILALLFSGLMAPAAATAATDSEPTAGHGRTLKVVLVSGAPVFGDPESIDPGNTLLFEETAYAHGRKAGDALTRIQFLEGGSFLLDCTVRLKNKGNLVFAGGEEVSNIEAKLTFAVTGGTGHFSGTGGHVDITPTTHRGEEAALLTFHLKH